MTKWIPHVPEQRKRIERVPLGEHIHVARDRRGNVAIEQCVEIDLHVGAAAKEQGDLSRRHAAFEFLVHALRYVRRFVGEGLGAV